MALHRTASGPQAVLNRDLVRIFLIAVAVIVLMIAITVVFGVHLLPPSYQIVPDPAGTLSF